MKKEFPFKKVNNKLEELYNKQEELEGEDATKSNLALWKLEDRILALEHEIEERPFNAGGARSRRRAGTACGCPERDRPRALAPLL